MPVTGIFKANNPYNPILLFLYALLLKLPMFLYPVVPVAEQPDGFMYRMLLRWLKPAGDSMPVIYSLIAFLLLVFQALYINRIVNNNRLMQKINHLPGMTYLLVTSLFSEWMYLSSPVVINTFTIFILSGLCNLYNQNNARGQIFNIGVMAGVATFFYFPSLAFGLLALTGIMVIRPFRLPEWIILLVGMATPYYFLISWLYLTDRLKEYEVPDVAVTIPVLRETTLGYIAIVMVLLLLIAGASFVQLNLRRQVVQTRKSWGLVFLYLLFSLFIPFLNETDNFEYWLIAALPVSVIASAAFLYPERKWFATLFHWGLVALVILNAYFLD